MFGEGLAGPLAGDENAATAEAEVFAVVRLGGAFAGYDVAVCVLRGDAVPEPVGALGRAGQDRT